MGTRTITAQTTDRQLKELRKKVGTVFQFPEAQLFGQTIAEDVAFGPQNYGVSQKEAFAIAKKTLSVVGLDASFLEQSPFDLSGGQQRRVAIAGVLALEPDVLVLDEPTAGLDPTGQMEMMELFSRLNKEMGTTIVLVTHRMEHVAEYADEAIVLDKGTIAKQGTPREIFEDLDLLKNNYLKVPKTVTFARALEERYGWSFNRMPLTTDELALALKDSFAQWDGETE